jgi:tetratricopeptide (TPR) repeat protein
VPIQETFVTKSCLTFVVPTYKPHFTVVEALIASIVTHAVDLDRIVMRLVVEQENVAFVERMAAAHPQLKVECRTTEDILESLGVGDAPNAFLKRVGKFTFQSIKKIGGILTASSEWVLVLDSESLFLKPFSACDLLEAYEDRKYIFYTNVSDRGDEWQGSLSDAVTKNAAMLVGGKPDRWFMEYYHWFYEVDIWKALVESLRKSGAFAQWMRHDIPHGVFENVLYYSYVYANGGMGYAFINVAEEMEETLPNGIGQRVKPALRSRFQVVGVAEHVTGLVSKGEMAQLRPFFDKYDLPFLRLEPSTFDPAFVEALQLLPSVRAITSSHRLGVMSKRVAVCVSGEFRSVFTNVRAIRSFTAAVACDIFVHSWSSDAVPVIRDALEPVRILEEPQPPMDRLVGMIAKPEPHSKDDRDTGSLRMFYGIQQSIDMALTEGNRYDYIVRIRPDMVFQQSLRDLLTDVANDEDYRDNVVYVPNAFHSQGINDQIAIGKISAMMRYGKIYDFAKNAVKSEYFNPEHIASCHLLDEGLELKTLPMHYVLLRKEPANIDWVGHLQRIQNETWWSAPLAGPWRTRTATAMFAAKRDAMRYMHRHDTFSDWDLLVSAEHLAPESKLFWGKPLVGLRVRHDYKNPSVWLTVTVEHDRRYEEYFVAVTPHGLRIQQEKSEGMVFVREGGNSEDIRLTCFGDDLDVPAADLVMMRLDGAHLPAWAFTRDPVGEQPATARRSGAGIQGPAYVRHGEVELLGRMLRSSPWPPIARVRALRARWLLRRARALRRHGRLLQAKPLYGRGLRMDPTLGREWVQYGHVLKDLGEWTAAGAAYQMALKLNPGDQDASGHYHATREHDSG